MGLGRLASQTTFGAKGASGRVAGRPTWPYGAGMKKLLIGFLLGVAAGWGAYWYVDHHKFEAWRTKQKVVHRAEATAESIKRSVRVTVDDVVEELARTGTVIREKARKVGDAVADAAADLRLTAAIKTKLLAEPGLSGAKINVDTADGVVTLSGTVTSTNQLVRAMNIALETEGVRKVVSTLQVKPQTL